MLGLMVVLPDGREGTAFSEVYIVSGDPRVLVMHKDFSFSFERAVNLKGVPVEDGTETPVLQLHRNENYETPD